MLFEKEYKKIKRDKWIDNINQTIELAQNSDNYLVERISKRLQTYLGEKNEDLEKEIFNEILRGYKGAAIFISKNPTKQLSAEIEQINKVKQINSDVIKLPSSGIGSIYLNTDGKIHKDVKPSPMVKSIDAALDYKNNIYYIMCKHTDGEGGHQDNVYSEINLFIQSVKNNKDENYKFIIIYSGSYYTTKREAELKRLNTTDKLIITHIDNIGEFINVS